jgi:hypothetical protein
MNAHHYTIILHPDVEEGGYTVTVPAHLAVLRKAKRSKMPLLWRKTLYVFI